MPLHIRSSQEPIPKRKESYTTYLYWGFAIIFVVLLILGFTYFI